MLSVMLFIGVERVRLGARESFSNTISQTDLIVGSKGGSIQLLLYTVFRIGSASLNVSYETYQKWKSHPEVAWTIPYSLGDSHRGYRVVGTDENFYSHYHYRRGQSIRFAGGRAAEKIFDVVLGAEVARKLGYQLGSKIVLSHGTAEVSLQDHEDKPFEVVGILEKTLTPIDQSLYVTLEGMEAIHVDWQDGAPPMPGEEVSQESLLKEAPPIRSVTAFLLGAKNRIETLSLQRAINQYPDEPLMAIIPGVTLSELWDGLSYAEEGLRIVSGFVVVVGLVGMLVSIYNSLQERRREMAILRSVGASPGLILGLLVAESVILTLVGSVLGVLALYAGLFLSQGWVEDQFGFYLPIKALSSREWIYLVVILGFGTVLGLVPGLRAYRNTVADGLTIKI
jgi:putative ABC transport system permease protein